jgi:hypothetical protein
MGLPRNPGGAKPQAHGGSRTLPSKSPGRWTGQTEDKFRIELRPPPDRFWIGRLTVSFGGDSHLTSGSPWTTLRISSPQGNGRRFPPPLQRLPLQCIVWGGAASLSPKGITPLRSLNVPGSGSPMRALRLHCSASAAEREVNRAAKGARQAPPAQGGRPAPISGAVLRGDQLTPPQMVGVGHTDHGGQFNSCRNGGC